MSSVNQNTDIFGVLMRSPSGGVVAAICLKLNEICGHRLDYSLAHSLEHWLDGERSGSYEFRFQGSLGFGGKIYFNPHRGLYVSCYREDETPERNSAIERMNAWLDAEVNPSIRGEG